MTREEAMKELSYIIDDMPSMECADWIEAISMGIKALEQEPRTDAISREAVIDIIEDVCPIYGNDYRYILRDKVNELPPVTPAEKVGHWEWNQYDSNPKIGNWHCSQCHGIGKSYYDYCPYCKAKMLASPTGAESEVQDADSN